MNVLAALVVLGLLILFHEAAHFLAATSQGIKVTGFSIGFGPALIKFERLGVTYALRALPLGGFVSFPDDDKEVELQKDDPDLLGNRPIPQRALVISAGVLANLLIAWLVLIGQAALIGLPSQPDPGVLILAIQPQEAAERAGLQPGDKILSLNQVKLGSGELAVEGFVKQVKASPNNKIELEIERADKLTELSITPAEIDGFGRVGAQLQPNVASTVHKANDLQEIIQSANTQFLDLLGKTINGYKGLVTNFGATAQQLSGPVKIVEMGAQLTNQGVSGLVLFTALISINLAVLNSLPLPLLDGGQMTLLLLEGLRGKPIPEQLQLAIMQSGFFLLVGLSVVLIIRDTTQLSIVQQFLNH